MAFVTANNNHIASSYNRAAMEFTSPDNVIKFGPRNGRAEEPLLIVSSGAFFDVAVALMEDGEVWVGRPTYDSTNQRVKIMHDCYAVSAAEGSLLMRLLFEKYPHFDKSKAYNPYAYPSKSSSVQYEDDVMATEHAEWLIRCSLKVRGAMVRTRNKGMSRGQGTKSFGMLGMCNQVALAGIHPSHHHPDQPHSAQNRPLLMMMLQPQRASDDPF